MNWKNLKDYKCPKMDCQGSLNGGNWSGYFCDKCPFSISLNKMTKIIEAESRVLEPPEFIKELRAKSGKPMQKYVYNHV